MDYPGKVITKTQVTPTQTSASGNWTLDDQAAAIKNNNWPVALVPNPISKSLRFNSADTAYLNRTFTTPTNNKIFTYNCWVKVNAAGNSIRMLTSGITGSPVDYAMFQFSPNSINYQETASSATALNVSTVAVFRDPSAWYMVTLVVDTTLATATDRIKIYVNSVLQTLTIATQVTQNYDPVINKNTRLGGIGGLAYNGSYINFSDCYLTEINFIDGQALTPSSFGMTNPQTGQWIPLKYSGTYGTNGFYLNFKDATSTTTLGLDYSGNANNWTTNNFSVTAGAGNDSLTDVPTPWFAYNTTGDVGGVFRGNYCTLNPNDNGNSNILLTNGNLSVSSSTTWDRGVKGTFGISSGKWYYEYTHGTVNAGTNPAADIGWTKYPSLVNSYANGGGGSSDTYLVQGSNGNKNNGGTNTAYGSAFTTGDVEMCAIDLDNGKIYWGKNGTWFASGDPVAGTNAAYTGVSGTFLPLWYWGLSPGTGGVLISNINFGQRPFAYTPPTGFRSLCTTNLPATAIGFGLTNQGDDYFNANLYTGTGSAFTLTGVGFQPDFGWFKGRNASSSYWLHDVVRGANPGLSTNSTAAEDTTAGQLTAFASDGYDLPNDSAGYLNFSGRTMVVWSWKAGGTGVTNTAGSITSTVSANTTSGFSIVTYTGNGTNGATVGHGLGVAPSWVIVKRRGASAGNWTVYSSALGATKYLYLNADSAEGTASVFWNNTAPTSTLVTLGDDGYVNANTGTYVAYCFAAVAGYSAFGSYAGNGSANGTFVYTGFRPEFVMIKTTNFAGYYWNIHDAARNPYNSSNLVLYPNVSNAEDVYSAGSGLDILSNGFKLRDAGGGLNGSGFNYIYMAFAESPFQFANAR